MIKNPNTKTNIQMIRLQATPIFRRYGVKRAAMFGSFARREEHQTSDADFLVEPPKTMTLLDFVGLKQDLEACLGRKVDLVNYRGIHPALKRRILREQISIYEKKH